MKEHHWDLDFKEGLEEVGWSQWLRKGYLGKVFFLCYTLILEHPEGGLETVTTDY